ncbi:MAG: hypothetical protein LBP32_06500 [Spirochaetaceae bacterium]|jgi:epoxyqueuosine reductase QueG|nr:hypothetical protein [Spirochaetaceae bacterium]
MNGKIRETVEKAVLGYEGELGPRKIWKPPLIAFLSASRKDLSILKRAVSPSHLLPEDVLPGARAVISFFIPFEDGIVRSNIGGSLASEEWALAYVRTNDLIGRIGEALGELLGQGGYRAGKIPATHNFDKKRLISDWSHRHIAYIAGLGTFGINNMLITSRGCCGRFGSLVTDCPLEDSPPSPAPGEKCLRKLGGTCGICQKRCPAGAYEPGGFNRHRCYEVCLKNAAFHRAAGCADVCGKCAVGLPCSLRDPTA